MLPRRLRIFFLFSMMVLFSCAGKRPSPGEIEGGLLGKMVRSIERLDHISYPNLKVALEIHPEVLPGVRILFLSNLYFFESDIVIYQRETPRELRHIETVAIDESENLYFLSRKDLPEFNRLLRKHKLQDLSYGDRLKLCQTFLLATWFVSEDLAFFSCWEDFRRFASLSRVYKHAFSNFLLEGESRGVPILRGHTLTEEDLGNDRRLRDFWSNKAEDDPFYENILQTFLRDDRNAARWLESLDSMKIQPLFHPPELEDNPELVTLLVASSGDRQNLTRFIFEVGPDGKVGIREMEAFPLPVVW